MSARLSVWFSRVRRARERRRDPLQHLEAAGIETRELAAPATRCSDACRRDPASVKHQRAGRKIERRQADLARDRSAALAPAQPPGDHQVQHEEELAVELEDDALAQAAKPDDGAAFNRADRWIGRAQEEGVARCAAARAAG